MKTQASVFTMPTRPLSMSFSSRKTETRTTRRSRATRARRIIRSAVKDEGLKLCAVATMMFVRRSETPSSTMPASKTFQAHSRPRKCRFGPMRASLTQSSREKITVNMRSTICAASQPVDFVCENQPMETAFIRMTTFIAKSRVLSNLLSSGSRSTTFPRCMICSTFPCTSSWKMCSRIVFRASSCARPHPGIRAAGFSADTTLASCGRLIDTSGDGVFSPSQLPRCSKTSSMAASRASVRQPFSSRKAEKCSSVTEQSWCSSPKVAWSFATHLSMHSRSAAV
mmetsp:Transcript_77968/g.252366  ORF Transcript_77968/g.252366 Transcript_77968/m.252366 type:complete len:283 (-) Transcript_77968:3-851(-)